MNIPGVGDVLGGGVASIVSAVGQVGDDWFTSDEEEQQLEIERMKLELEGAKLADRAAERQVEVNLAEAQHPSLIVAGWRPGAGWICVAGMGYYFLIYPIFGPLFERFLDFQLREIPFEALSGILLGMLGLGGARTWEKVKGVATSNIERSK